MTRATRDSSKISRSTNLAACALLSRLLVRGPQDPTSCVYYLIKMLSTLNAIFVIQLVTAS